MKILFVAPYIPNQIRVRPYQFIRTLLQHGHEITLLAVFGSQEEQADIEQLQGMGVKVYAQRVPMWRSLGNSLRAVVMGTAIQGYYSWHPALAKSAVRIANSMQPDIIHVEHLRGTRYGLYLKSHFESANKAPSSRKLLPVVWDSVDCISSLFEQAAKQSRSLKGRLMTRLELGPTRRYEGQLVHHFDQVVVTSQNDRAALENLAQTSVGWNRRNEAKNCTELMNKIHVVPNGVDLSYFAPNGIPRDEASIVFTGKMSYHANITAALHLVEDIMPRVWAQYPNAEVWIVGKDPTSEIQALASHKDATERRVVVTGTVPDLRPYLQKATIAVAPVPYGAGIQNKVLEAMACGTAVVASPQAASALRVEHNRELQIADSSEAFAAALAALLGDPGCRQELGRIGRMFVEQNHSWALAADCLEAVYRKALTSRGWNDDSTIS